MVETFPVAGRRLVTNRDIYSVAMKYSNECNCCEKNFNDLLMVLIMHMRI